ncbi:P-loop NTPase fold protein, partial [Acinetobacter baumannii]|nr:P-loop NTPase fold protein [Acinetobacter baumannii]
TILNLIEQKLQAEKKEDYILIKFDAWLYQGFDDARAALIEVVTLEIAKLVEDNKTLLDKTKTITKRVNKLRLLAMAAEGAS